MAQPSAMQNVMMDKAVDMSLEMTAKMLGMPKETVTKIVQAGLPMMAQMAETNPDLLKKLYGHSMEMMPEPVQQFYEKLAENPEAQQKMIDQYKTMYGPMLDAVNREAASQAGTTPETAEKTMATTLPALTQAMNKTAGASDEQGFGGWLKGLRS